VVTVVGSLPAINGLVLVFNLVQAFPLDSGRVPRSILGPCHRALAKTLTGQHACHALLLKGLRATLGSGDA
jgi:hypothetical protein